MRYETVKVGRPVAVHGGKKGGKTCLTFACVRWINRAHRAYFGGHVVKSFFAQLGDYDDVAVCRATRHLSDYLAIRYYLPRLKNLRRLFEERSAALKDLVLGKVGDVVLKHWEVRHSDYYRSTGAVICGICCICGANANTDGISRRDLGHQRLRGRPRLRQLV